MHNLALFQQLHISYILLPSVLKNRGPLLLVGVPKSESAQRADSNHSAPRLTGN